jgi:hypothetical protein
MYNIIRIYRPDLNKRSRLIKRGITLEQAQKHCSDPKTATALYFDAYERQ